VRVSIITCDRCGKKQSDSATWETAVKEMALVFPGPDGTNPVTFKGDLCRDCRQNLANVVYIAFSKKDSADDAR